MAGRNAKEVAKALDLGNGAFESKRPILMVIPRYAARFTLNDRLDDRASWIAWPEVARMRIEKKQVVDPLVELDREFRDGGPLAPYDPPEETIYELRELKVRLSVL
ncbi:hypothetical protein ABIB73_001379 [Bradyrhizobium sp. F1.4.3]|uniref:hypothetical protein n=1 Tax=Bradyrhizobium sp. F1.4.3 TaxID=3156356 RepID=UPI0033960852